MRIFRVTATYGELRSSGYPSFSNTRHECTLAATLQEGEDAKAAFERLHGYARSEVKRLFGDVEQLEMHEMCRPYVPAKPSESATK